MAYWVGVVGPYTANTSCPPQYMVNHFAFAQTGWTVYGSDFVPHHFYELAGANGCLALPVKYATATYGTDHGYKVVTGATNAGDYVDIYKDGTSEFQIGTDWYGGIAFEIAAEPHSHDDYLGSNTFADGTTCTLSLSNPVGCDPNTPIDTNSCTQSYSAQGIDEGCYTGLVDPCGHYYFHYQSSNSAFHVHDVRSEGISNC